MYYSPYTQMITNYYRQTSSNSYIRMFHALPDTPAVDINANGNLIVKDLNYKEISPYFPVSPGSYNITLYPTGQTTSPVISTVIYIPENTIFNMAAIGTAPFITLYTIPEPTTAQNFGRPCIRFIHLSPNAPAVDIKVSDGTKIFDNVGFKDITDYACLPAGTYTFTINTANTNTLVLTVPDVTLNPNTFYTIYAVGQVGKTPTLEALILSEPR